MSLETVDNAFEAMSSVLAFGHMALLRSMYVGVAALIIFWYAFFTDIAGRLCFEADLT